MSKREPPGTLNAQRAGVLRVWATGARPATVPRSQIRWFVAHGWIVLGPRPAPSPTRRSDVGRTITLTDKARAAIGGEVVESTKRELTDSAGYISDRGQLPR